MASNATTIPTVDISTFTLGADFQSRQQVAKELAQSCHAHGFVGITGHGVPADLLQEAFEMSRKLFDLPTEDKMKAPHPKGMTPHRGYSGPAVEKIADKSAAMEKNEKADNRKFVKARDYKESYEIGSEANLEQYNIWLPEEVLPGFRHFTTELFWTLQATGMTILNALMMGLAIDDVECEEIRKLHSGHNNQLRLSHYPPVSAEQLDTMAKDRLTAHRDWCSFTLLFQDNIGGLEFADSENGPFTAATPKEDMLYLNVGDMLMRLSNGYYPSALHRVTLPREVGLADGKKASITPARYSIPYFVAPDAEGTVAPSPSLVKVSKRAAYEPITFKDYSDRRFAAISSG